VSVAEGQEINYTCYLVNVSGQAQSADLANPLCNPEIDAQGGQTAWAYEPSAETNAIQIVPAGEVLSFSLGIPTSELQAGEAYVLSSFPNIGTVGSPDIGFGQNMQLNQAITMEASANTVSSSVDSSTPPCSAPDVYCGTFQIMSGNLTANGDGSLLDLTLLETGNVYMSSATVYINGTVIGIPPAFAYEPPGNIGINLAPKQQTVLGLAVPNSTISIQAGSTYTVMVDAWVGSPGKASTSSQETINIAAAASGPATSTSASAISTTRPTSTFSSASSIAPSTLLGTGAVVAVAAAVLEIGRRRAGKAVSERTVGHGNATIPAEVLLA